MGKILSLSNTEDSLWYQFPANDETINALNIVFEINDLVYHEIAPNKFTYKNYLNSGRGEKSFTISNNDIIAYFIFTKSTANLIIRKSLKWKEYEKSMNSVFDFS